MMMKYLRSLDSKEVVIIMLWPNMGDIFSVKEKKIVQKLMNKLEKS